jgi:acetyltransferase-like isoleucine patch superfamily enzyme
MKYFEDFRGYLFLLLRISRLFLFSLFSTFFSKIIFILKGIKFERGNSFYGVPIISRVPFSSIRIGVNNTFRSDKSSNLIGVNHKCIISTHKKDATIQIGDNCGFSGVTIGASEKIIIGNHVLCGANSVITDFDWHSTRYSSGSKPVIIHDNVWLGLNTVVLKGVEIGQNSIIGANSIVVKSIPENVIAAGNPCRVLKKI